MALAQANPWSGQACGEISLAPLRESLGVLRAQKVVRVLSEMAGMPVCDQDYRPWFSQGNSVAIVVGDEFDITAAAGSFAARANAMCVGGTIVVGQYASSWVGSGIVRIAANERAMMGATAKRASACKYIVVENISDPKPLLKLHAWLADAACWPNDSTNPAAAFGGARVVVFLSESVVAKIPAGTSAGQWLTAGIPSAVRAWKMFSAPLARRGDFDGCGLQLLPVQGISLDARTIELAEANGARLVSGAPADQLCVFEGVVRYKFSRKRKRGATMAEVKPPVATLVIGGPCVVTHAVVCTVMWCATTKKVVACDPPVFVPAQSVGVFVRALDAAVVRVDKIGTPRLPVVGFPDGRAFVIPNVSLSAGTCTITSCPVRPGNHVAVSQRNMHYDTPQRAPPPPSTVATPLATTEPTKRPTRAPPTAHTGSAAASACGLILPSSWKTDPRKYI